MTLKEAYLTNYLNDNLEYSNNEMSLQQIIKCLSSRLKMSVKILFFIRFILFLHIT